MLDRRRRGAISRDQGDLQFAVPDELDDETVRGAQGRALGHGERGPEPPAGVPDARDERGDLRPGRSRLGNTPTSSRKRGIDQLAPPASRRDWVR